MIKFSIGCHCVLLAIGCHCLILAQTLVCTCMQAHMRASHVCCDIGTASNPTLSFANMHLYVHVCKKQHHVHHDPIVTEAQST